MNTKHLSLAFAAATALLAGCAKSPIEEVKTSEQFTDLELAYVGATETKAAIDGTTFPEEGEIGLFLFKDELAETPYGESGCTNVKYSYNSDKKKWTASPSIKVGSTPGYLYGYYPYDSEVANIKAIPVASSLNGDDVMYAEKVSDVTDATASQTSITMNHALARVSITVKNNGYAGAAKLSKIKFSGAETAPEGTLNALDGSVTATKSDVTLDVTGDAQTITAAGTTYECLLVPSKAVDGKQTVTLTLTIDGEDKTASLSDGNGVIIAQGTKSNITITLSNTGISVQAVSVDDWNVVEVGGHKVTVNTANDSVLVNLSVDDTKSTLKIRAALPSRPCFLKYTVSPSDKCTCTAVTDSTTRELTLTISSVTEDITLGIAFPDKYNISVAAEDGSMGEAYINTPGTASGSYYEGESLSLYAVPADGFHIFRKWSDGNTDNPRTFTAGTADATLTAEFSSVDIFLTNGRTVAVNVEEGAQADIIIDNTGSFKKDNTAVITAHCATTGRMLELQIDKESACGAVSAARNGDTYTFTIPSITEDISVTIKYVRCKLTLLSAPADSMGTFNIDGRPRNVLEGIIGGTAVATEAVASANHRFVKWTDSDGTATARTVTVTADSTITAEFIRQWNVKAQPAPGSEGMGTFKIDNAAATEKTVDNGASVKIQAMADSGYGFVKWTDGSGAALSTDNPYTISSVTSDITLNAVFEELMEISATVKPLLAGTATGTGNYLKDSLITLVATPAGSGVTFVGWVNQNAPTDTIKQNPYNFTVSEPASYIAVFRLKDALPGLFTVDSSGKQVMFSKGNLWCDGTGDGYSAACPVIKSWNFEADQYESYYPKTSAEARSINHISHFMWCGSASESVKQGSGQTAGDVFFTDKEDFAMGGFTAWRTLTKEEWKYLFGDNDARDGRYKTGVTVCGKTNCVVLVPDDWNLTANPLQSSYDETAWAAAEAAGAVCLPAAGWRLGGNADNNYVREVGLGEYWSGSPNNDGFKSYNLSFGSDSVNPDGGGSLREYAYSVRLVADL